MHYRSLVMIFAVVAISVPQVIVEIPQLSESAKVTDYFALIIIPIAAIFCRYEGFSGKLAVGMVAAVGFAVVVVLARILIDSDRESYQSQAPHLGRLFAMHAPLLLLAAMPMQRKYLTRCMIGFGALSVAVTLVIATLYHFGSAAFDAHQTFRRGGGDMFHRLGGLPHETGAFAFNAMIGLQVLLVGLALAEKRKLFSAVLWLFLPLFVAFIYHESLVRVSLLSTLVFFSVTVLGVNHSRMSSRFAVLCVILMGCVGVLVLSAAGYPVLDVEVDRMSVEGNMNQITSGRAAHWVAGMQATFADPSYTLFGMGYRAPDFVLGHPIENMIVFHFATYGIVGTALFALLYLAFALPIVRQAIHGDFASGVFTAILLAAVAQWQVNDINSYYQTFPVLMLFAGWFAAIIQTEQYDTEAEDDDETAWEDGELQDEFCLDELKVNTLTFQRGQSDEAKQLSQRLSATKDDASRFAEDEDYWSIPDPKK